MTGPERGAEISAELLANRIGLRPIDPYRTSRQVITQFNTANGANLRLPPEPPGTRRTVEEEHAHVEPGQAVLVTLDGVQAERLTWLWPGRLPAGKLVTLDGDPSLGKSTLAVTFAAHVSTGRAWPDGASCPVGDVVVLSAEDGLADTIRPRLDAAAGNAARVHALTAVRTIAEDGVLTTRPPTLADIKVIREVLKQTRARLLIVDVFMAYLPGKTDSHRDQDVRAVLHRLAELADTTGCTFLLLRHLNKTPGGSPMYRGGGSIGIVGAARAGFLVAPDPDDNERRVLACVKSNLARTPESLSYRLEGAPGLDVARVVWTGTSTHDAAGLLQPVESDDERRDRQELDEWLYAFLVAKPVLVKTVMRAARDAGYNSDQVKRAKKRVGVVSAKTSMDGGWTWTLPGGSTEGSTRTEGSTEGSEGSGPQEPAPFAPFVLPSEPPRPANGIGILCAGCGQRTHPPLVAGRCGPCVDKK